MAITFVSADPQSPTSRALACFFGFGGLINILSVAVRSGWLAFDPRLAGRLFAVASPATFVAAFEWLLRVRHTEAAGDRHGPTGEHLLRMAQGLAVLHGVIGVAYPDLREEAFRRRCSPLAHNSARCHAGRSPLPGAWLPGLRSHPVVERVSRRPKALARRVCRLRWIASIASTTAILISSSLPRGVSNPRPAKSCCNA